MLSSSSVVPPGNCGIHGYHGRAACPNCSTSALPFTPIFQSPPPGPASVSPAERAANYLERAIEADKEIVPLELPAGAIQLLYDVLGHFPHAPGSWHTAARAYCSIALMEARDGH